MLTNFNQQLYARRRRANSQGLFLSMCAMALGLTVLLWILFVLFSNGIAALDWNLLTKDTPAPGTEGGGLRNAIVGSLMMVGLSVRAAQCHRRQPDDGGFVCLGVDACWYFGRGLPD